MFSSSVSKCRSGTRVDAAATWGVMITLGIRHSGLSAGSGCLEKMSRPAPAILPARRWSISASSSSTPPRARLIRKADGFIAGGGAHVGQLLFLYDVDVHVLVAGILAHDLSLIDFLARADENFAAFLQIVNSVAGGFAGAVGDGVHVRRDAGAGSDFQHAIAGAAGAVGDGGDLGEQIAAEDGRELVPRREDVGHGWGSVSPWAAAGRLTPT